MLDIALAKISPLLNELPPSIQKGYIQILMLVLSRAAVAASHSDPLVKKDVAGFPVGMTIQMIVLPNIASFCLKVTKDHTFELYSLPDSERPNLSVKFKQLTLAFKVLSLQESTARAFANDRIVADGDVSDAIRFVRCLNQVESLVLPRSLAKLAVKQYPDITLKQKVLGGAKVLLGALRA